MATLILLASVLFGHSRAYDHPQAPAYSLVRNYSGQIFFDSFDFYTKPDPANSFVQYVDMHTANDSAYAGFVDYVYTDDLNNTRSIDKLIYLGVDFTTNSSSGRQSVRMEASETFNRSLIVADIYHMPGGCGVWPAFWLLGTGLDWPQAGEIDVLEGINDQALNRMSLHTDKQLVLDSNTHAKLSISNPGCDQRQQGQTLSSDCNVASSGGTGCSIMGTNETSQGFGSTFNANQGGYLVTEFTSEWIKIWQTTRSTGDMNFAKDVRADLSIGSMRSWGPPTALFSQNGTDLSSYFMNLRMIFNTAFCGPWIDGTWNTSSCASRAATCQEYVASNPSAFVDAYWLVKGVYVYQSNSADQYSARLKRP
ncbi:uncharacterized protein A1O9_09748 [Exophiala aquamarina CBS 119918]|uniref:GH16 domain-containing protein n=1 Tax=Exophiala aquamarina CBS 119918 TaxID=1182545 RepID=A0A072P3U0_9EURO|nr:uncharacterized protein A1O9_09748 [Exophiala aquamarina CBS 119918]KEF53953.1 hypothetical protein A1O9_09748 [Exophiala aquamarina CBS 119918]